MQELVAEAAGQGIDLTPAQLAQFEQYYQELVAWNERFNLTRIVEYGAVQIQHFLDSLAILARYSKLFTAETRIIDVGAGPGLPGIALKIARPEIHLTLVDSVGKKVQFLQHIIGTLELEHAVAVHARAEDLGQMPDFRAYFDVAIARAVGDLAVLAEYLLPLVHVGGVTIAQKGAHVAAEVTKAAEAIRLLGGGPAEVSTYTLPGLDEPRSLVLIPKIRPTPSAYPRRAGVPTQAPIGSAAPPSGPAARWTSRRRGARR